MIPGYKYIKQIKKDLKSDFKNKIESILDVKRPFDLKLNDIPKPYHISDKYKNTQVKKGISAQFVESSVNKTNHKTQVVDTNN